jgi:hypothetical protein
MADGGCIVKLYMNIELVVAMVGKFAQNPRDWMCLRPSPGSPEARGIDFTGIKLVT